MDLKSLRKTKGYTQSEVAELLDISLRTYKRYELNQRSIHSFKYLKLMEELRKIPAKTASISENSLKIAVIGAGYVGLSLSALLSVNNDVTVLDIDENRVNDINNRRCYLRDKSLEKLFKNPNLKLKAMKVNDFSFKKTQIVVIAVNTDFNEESGQLDMSNVLSSISKIRKNNKKCLIVIKSTVPMGFTKNLKDPNIIFCPEFLREGSAVNDTIHPSRIIIGVDNMTNKVRTFAKCLLDISITNKDAIYMSSHEAEAVKLFSNAYLALRVAYFNELDSYAEINSLSTKNIINGVSLDPRIGDFYNNPSFGYGGYCLPKDTAQLKNDFSNIGHNDVVSAIVNSNKNRKKHIVNQIVKLVNKNDVIGFYKISMKKDSNNYRGSSTLDVINELKRRNYKVIIYDSNYVGEDSVSFDELISQSNLIVTNRMEKELSNIPIKVYTRDIFNNN